MNLYLSAVADESKFAEFVHQLANRDRVVPIISANVSWLISTSEQKKKAREALLARIKKLVDQILFNPAVPGQKIRHE